MSYVYYIHVRIQYVLRVRTCKHVYIFPCRMDKQHPSLIIGTAVLIMEQEQPLVEQSHVSVWTSQCKQVCPMTMLSQQHRGNDCWRCLSKWIYNRFLASLAHVPLSNGDFVLSCAVHVWLSPAHWLASLSHLPATSADTWSNGCQHTCMIESSDGHGGEERERYSTLFCCYNKCL